MVSSVKSVFTGNTSSCFKSAVNSSTAVTSMEQFTQYLKCCNAPLHEDFYGSTAIEKGVFKGKK